MVEFANGFVASEHEDSTRDPLPEGTYDVVAVDSEKSELGSGNGHKLTVKFEVASEKHKGRYLWENFNLWHQKEQVRKIAAADLSRLMKAVDLEQITDSSQLHNKPLTVTICHGQSKGNIYANIKTYHKYGTFPEGGVTAGTAGETTEKAPWE